jgi:hypothetical protein
LRTKCTQEEKEMFFYDKLKLTIEWSRIDLAYSDVLTGEEVINQKQKLTLFTMALVQNKHMFIELLLETGFDLKSFLTKKTLYFLYNCEEVNIHFQII